MSEIEFLGKMPNPFLKDDKTLVSYEEWKTYKYELLNKITDIEYGGMPPKAEYVEIEPLNMIYRGAYPNCYRIHAGTKEKQLSFVLNIYLPLVIKGDEHTPIGADEKYPVILTGDGCYPNMETEVVEEALKRGYVAAKFNRLEIANDVKGKRESDIHRIYPDMSFTDIL